MIIKQAPQQLAPVTVKTLLKLAMRQASGVGPVQKTNQRIKLLTATGKPSRRTIPRPPTAIELTDKCTIPTSIPAGQDFTARGVKFTSTGVEIGGHAGHLSWSTLDMNNADFDTLFMTPRRRRAPSTTRSATTRQMPQNPEERNPTGLNPPQSPPTPPPPSRPALHAKNPKAPTFQGLLRRHRPSLSSLQGSRTHQSQPACRKVGWGSHGLLGGLRATGLARAAAPDRLRQGRQPGL
jgi:hypothetical protein